MSDLYRSAISARLAKLPQQLPHDEEMEEAGDSIGALPGSGIGPPAFPSHSGARSTRNKRTPNPEYAPISASGYFSEASQVLVERRNLDMRTYYTPPKYADGTVIICHHGAGYSGLTFACMAKEITELSKGECGVLAFDARRHGKTTSSENDEDLSIDVLVADFFELVRKIFPDPVVAPTLLLVGHSMGGSVVTRTCPMLLEQKYKITGVVVLDVVEGSALEALPFMHNLLNSRPDGFDSVEAAVEWHVRTNTIRNPTSARISIPAIVTPTPPGNPNLPAFQWRTTLRSTAPYWQSWFTGLSRTFLASRSARLLVLAGTDRLDKELMIGQMQGKFQMVVIPNVGHMLQEDDPTHLAEILVDFWRRNERLQVGIKKVGDA